MCFKFFTRLFLILGMLCLFSHPIKADEIQIGSGSSTDANLPTHSYYKYALTQQIYTAAEIEEAGGGAGTINSIAFYNGGSTKTRNFSIYLVNTEKESFSGNSDWITVSANDLVFSGEVEMTAGTWKTISFDNPFSYDGGNLAVVVDDNTGNDVSGMSCRIYTASATQSIYYRNDYTNPDPTNPTISGTPTTNKNQIILDIETSAVSCAKPKSLTATDITAHTATLTWVAGAEEQTNWDVYVTTTASDVPDENTTPIYQVTSCSKALSDLTAQTTYYAYVRANCGDSDLSKWAFKSFATTREALAIDAANPYSKDFETSNDWGFTNGTLTNNWCWGSAINNGGSKAMYVSKDGGTTHEYAHGNMVIYASKLFNFSQGTYTFSFDWIANGESNYDYLRVALIPGDMEFTAGTSLPSGVGTSTLPTGWIALDGGGKLNLKEEWQSKVSEATLSGTYTMVFLWRNDSSGGNQPPAAIDNIYISFMTCPRPTALTASDVTGRTATLSWTENGTATNWVLQYATNTSFTENSEVSVSGTSTKELTGLTPETKYYARVKAVLGDEESSWGDVCSFTTTATCVKPTNLTANDITAHAATIGWTNGEEGQSAWEISYSTSIQSNPENGTVVAITTNPYTLTELTPETSYYVYVRANCGDEDGKSAWSSYKYFTTLATCVKPTELTASNVTSSTATITWTAGEAGQTNWNLQYKKSSESTWTTVATETTSYNLIDLSPVTTYNVRVQANCGEGDLSQWTNNTNFTTECSELTLPYTCDFEGDLETSPYSSYPMPKCWTRTVFQSGYYGSYTYYPYVFTATSSQPYAHGGNGANSTSGHSLRFYQTSSSTNECAVLPAISSEYEMNKLQIKFWAAVQSSQGTLQIGIMDSPNNPSSFIAIQEVNISNTYSNGFQEFTVPFSTYSGTDRYIALMCGTGSSYAYFLIDDVTVEEIPSCRIPTDLEATVNSATQTTLTWQAGGDETEWELEVSSEHGSLAHLFPVSNNPIYLLTTTRATTYTVRVRANCGNGDLSEWSEPISFTSECGTMTIDEENAFSEDFENIESSDFPPVCWDRFSHEMSGYNYWYLSANNGLGSNAAFSYWNEGYAFLVLPYMHLSSSTTLSFDYLIGSGNYDESCSVVVSTDGMTFNDFNQTIWMADEDNLPSGKASCTVSLSDFANQDLYVAFKFKGSGTSGCTWYIDNVEIHTGSNQSTELSQGWNWFSTYIEMDGVNGLDLLKESLGNHGLQIKSRTDGYTDYENEEWFGDLDEATMSNEQMYMILTNADCTVELQGTTALTENHNITINPGWNWIGYPCTQEMAVEDALLSFNPEESDQIKSFNDYTDYDDGSWFGGLETMTPGLGFMYYSNSSEPKNLVYHVEDNSKNPTNPSTRVKQTHWTPVTVGDMTMTCTSVLVIDGVEQYNPQLEIGVFSNDSVCRGAKLPKLKTSSNRYIYSITIYGETGYTYTCKVYDHTSGKELPLTFVMNTEEPLVYEANHRFGSPSNPYPITFENANTSFTKEIIGYGENTKGGYYLLTSPIEEVNPGEVTNMLTNTYDLYYFDQSQDLEWINYKYTDESNNQGFNLIPGKGYLYANSQTVTLTFNGVPYTGNGEIELVKDDNAAFSGWNLVGNPFAQTAFIDREFYVMNEDGSGVIASETDTVAPMEGFFVVAASNGETMTINTTEPETPGKNASIVLNLSNSRGTTIDRSIIRFGKESTLPKFMLNQNSTKIYIPQNDKDYAVVTASTDMGEMPINFKAEKNGTYTLTLSEGIVIANEAKPSNLTGYSYLHLIDHLTGADINLLETPNYSFEAHSTDFVSRFKLVFATGNSENDDVFAFYSNGQITITTDANNAFLQVIDMLGRTLVEQRVETPYHGVSTTGIIPGIYTLRLIDGDLVKTQKIVIE